MAVYARNIGATGTLSLKHIKAPGPGLLWHVRNFFPHVWSGLWRWKVAKLLGIMTLKGEWSFVHFAADGSCIARYNRASCRLITDAWVDFVVDQMQTETSEFGDAKYHEAGTGGTGENVSDTDIETGVESPVVGTQTEGATSEIYRSVGTVTFTGSHAVVEWTLMTQSGAGTLVDRTVFGAVNVTSGESIQATYELTWSSGG